MMNPTATSLLFWVAFLALVYGFVLYPALLSLIGLLSRRDVHQPHFPRVSLLIAAYNEERMLRAKLENALALDYPREKLTIWLGSDGSTDRTVEIAQEFADRGVNVISFTARRGKASVLNDLVERAAGEMLLLCDANVLFEPQSLRRMAARLSDPKVGAVTGDVRIASEEANFGEGERRYYLLERLLQIGESRVGSVMGVDGGMYIIRRELFPRLPASALNDDFIASMAVIGRGFRIAYEPTAIAHETATPTARQEWRRRVRISAGAVQLLKWRQWPPLSRPIECWQFASHKLVRWLNPLWLGAILVCNLLLYREGWIYQFALAAQGALYLTSVLAALVLPFRWTRIGGTAFYFVMSHIAMAVGLVRGVLNWESSTWVVTERRLNESAASG